MTNRMTILAYQAYYDFCSKAVSYEQKAEKESIYSKRERELGGNGRPASKQVGPHS